MMADTATGETFLRKSLSVLALVMTIGFANGGEVAWLDKVTSPAANVVLDQTTGTTPLLDGITAESWESRRAEIVRRWESILGPLPQGAPDGLQMEVLSDDSLATCTRQIVKYQAEPGRFVRAYVLRPVGDESTTRPGVVLFHPTNRETIKVVAGTGGRPHQHLALPLVERGFVVVCPENYIFEESTYNVAVAEARKRHPESVGMATMLADGMRAVDLLESLPGVDLDRIGAIGHSLGAKEVLYLMAFDSRVKAGVFSEGGIGIRHSNWDAEWYLGKQINMPGFQHEHSELLALIQPRALLIFGGESGRGAADGDRTWPFVTAANEISRRLGETARIGLINHRQGHIFLPDMAEQGFDWLETYTDGLGRVKAEN